MVTVYSKENCGQCEDTKQMMNSLGIAYTEIDISKDPSAIKKLRAMKMLSAPVVVTEDGEKWAGFKRDKIEALATEDSLDDIFA